MNTHSIPDFTVEQSMGITSFSAILFIVEIPKLFIVSIRILVCQFLCEFFHSSGSYDPLRSGVVFNNGCMERVLHETSVRDTARKIVVFSRLKHLSN